MGVYIFAGNYADETMVLDGADAPYALFLHKQAKNG
jgi:hypothetical protein